LGLRHPKLRLPAGSIVNTDGTAVVNGQTVANIALIGNAYPVIGTVRAKEYGPLPDVNFLSLPIAATANPYDVVAAVTNPSSVHYTQAQWNSKMQTAIASFLAQNTPDTNGAFAPRNMYCTKYVEAVTTLATGFDLKAAILQDMKNDAPAMHLTTQKQPNGYQWL
jgi:hypothetical protein